MGDNMNMTKKATALQTATGFSLVTLTLWASRLLGLLA
jgi:hypothetical protein